MKNTLKSFALIASIALAALAMSGCSQIDTGNVGVESTMGQVKAEELPAGVHFTLFKRVTEVSTKETPLALNDLKPQTSDKITLADLDIDIYLQISPDKASDIMTRFVGDMAEVKGEDGARVGLNYATRQAREVIYGAVAKRNSATIHTERAELSSDIVRMLQTELDASAGKGWYFVRSANVRNLVTDPALEANIKAAANAQFESKKKDIEIEVARKEAERKRIEAAGDADVIRLRAEAIQKQGGDHLVELEKIKKWNGVLPTNTGGAIPFINIK